jgi:hypothetical protein
MGYVPMTFPAFSIHLHLARKVMIAVTVFPDRSGNRGMTGDTVGLHPFRCILTDLNPFVKSIHSEGTGVFPAISHLGHIFINDTGSGKMTLNTRDVPGMRTMLPCRILSIHDMTVDTGLWILGQI